MNEAYVNIHHKQQVPFPTELIFILRIRYMLALQLNAIVSVASEMPIATSLTRLVRAVQNRAVAAISRCRCKFKPNKRVKYLRLFRCLVHLHICDKQVLKQIYYLYPSSAQRMVQRKGATQAIFCLRALLLIQTKFHEIIIIDFLQMNARMRARIFIFKIPLRTQFKQIY